MSIHIWRIIIAPSTPTPLRNGSSGYATGHPGSGWASVRNIYTQPFTEPLKALISVQVASWLLDDCRINDGLYK